MNPTDHTDDTNTTRESGTEHPIGSAGSAGELATVHHLPGRPATGVDQQQSRPGGAVESARPVIEGEIVSDEEWALLTDQRAQRAARLAGYRHDLTRVAHGTAVVVRGGRTLARAKGGPAWRFVRRHGTYVLRGAEAERQRRKAEKGQTDARAARKAAVAKGEHDRVAELNKQIIEQRKISAEAAKLRFELGWEISKKTALVLVLLAGISMVAGIFNGFGHWFGDWNLTDVLRTMGTIFTTTAAVVSWSVLHAWLIGLAGVGVWASRRWRDGHKLGEQVLPESLRSTSTNVAYLELNENTLVAALANIGNAKLNEAIKAGWPNRDTDQAWVRFPMLADGGKAYTCKIRLPMGASVAAVNKSKALLAHNLGCRAQELFVDPDPNDPTVMDLFRLEPGVLREPVDPYPLLTEGSTDFFAGFPVGMSPRGEVVSTTVNERNFVFAGIMGSGKTTLILDLLAGAALDPLVDIDVFCFAENFDYDPLEPVLSTFVKGDTEDNVQACLEHIRHLHADLAVRGKLLEKHGVRSVNREVAAKEPGLRPRIVVIEECQAFFRQDKAEDRKELVNMLVRFYSAARKYGVVLVFATPNPSDASLPRDLMAVTTNKACGAIGDKTRNNIVLGDKAHENGVSALGLKPKTKDALNDCGTTVTVGFMDTPGLLRSFYLTPDELGAIAARGAELRGGKAQAARLEPQVRDLIEDLATVMVGDEPVNAGDLVSALRNLDPSYRPYRELRKPGLVQLLAEVGIRPPATRNLYPVDPVTVRQVFAARQATTGGDGDEG